MANRHILRGMFLALIISISAYGAPLLAHAQTEYQVQQSDQLLRARVVSAVAQGDSLVPGTNVTSTKQLLTVQLLDGSTTGQIVTFTNDYTQLTPGEVLYIRHITDLSNGTEYWSVADPYRLPVLIGAGLAFLLLLFIFGGIQGVRGLISLIGSLFVIVYFLIPNLYAGHSPILISVGVAALIIVIGSYITHGFHRTTTSAMFGMLVTVLITGVGTYAVIYFGHFSGFTSETNVYLNFDTDGRISMVGILFGGIMIGLLGVLYDIAIGQAVAVEELFLAGSYSRSQVFARAMRIGREHIGALVNTLAIAYVGAALPLMLLFKESDAPIGYILNSELFATEIIRILMGSIGLILAVPITTLIAVRMLQNARRSKDGAADRHSGHGHSHS